jgi:hypothetical protein
MNFAEERIADTTAVQTVVMVAVRAMLRWRH